MKTLGIILDIGIIAADIAIVILILKKWKEEER